MTQALNQQLRDMKAAATQQTATYHTSRNQLHSAFVNAYLWWRDADQQKGYLAGVYKDASIKVRKRSGSNSPNFYPLVRLIWSIDITKQAGTVSNWARSLLALHVEYTDKPKLYVKNARADLLNYIKDNGGLGALRSDRKMTEQELEQEEREGIKKEKRGRPKRNAPPHALTEKLQPPKRYPPKLLLPVFPQQ